MKYKINLINIFKQTFVANLFNLVRNAMSSKYRRKYSLKRMQYKSIACQVNSNHKKIYNFNKNVLVVGSTDPSIIALEVAILLSLQKSGYKCYILLEKNAPFCKATYSCFGNFTFVDPSSYCSCITPFIIDSDIKTLNSLSQFKFMGVKCGQFALSSYMRIFRDGNPDFRNKATRARLLRLVNTSISNTLAANKIIKDLNPDILLMVDRGYVGNGELFETSLNNSINVLTWYTAHCNSSIVLKRYSSFNKDDHPLSLSSNTLELISRSWTDLNSKAVFDELSNCYDSGEWYAEVGTQFFADRSSPLTKDIFCDSLNITNNNKIAVIFPHIFWDGTFFWGTDLFDNYHDWFLNTIEAASLNTSVNWVVKIHPANIIKNERDGFSESIPKEVEVILTKFGKLPPNIYILPADTDFKSIDIYKIIDYCITVRGTVGIEAACFGVPVVTAGTGRYDRRGFTLDSDSIDQYFSTLRNIQLIKPLDSISIKSALIYAHGSFISRVVRLPHINSFFDKSQFTGLVIKFNYKTLFEIQNSSLINGLSEWIDTDLEDFCPSTSSLATRK